MFEENKNQAYKYLDAALPLQSKEPLKSKSLLEFVLEEPGQLANVVTETEELNKINDQYYFMSKKNIHQIGDSLCSLFKAPVYKSHQLINTNDDYHFASCQTDDKLKINSWHNDYPLTDEHLQFESRFQSGNLAIAACSTFSTKVYYLALQRDVNSARTTTQWFYFRVKNRTNTGLYTFHIVNYVKPFSMFKIGMKPCVYSVKRGKGWERACGNIEYRKNSIMCTEEKSYYTLTFTYQFNHIDDEVFFAYCYPYTYSRLQKFLDQLQPKHIDKMRRKVLTKTLGDNVVELVLITNPQIANKKVVCITARAHPGETISSFACEALILFLLSSHPSAEKMRNQFIIKIIPMLNPDGVINGSYRTSLSGDDLNRQWKYPDKNRHHQIFYSKKLITQSEYKKLLYIDLHGHSKKRASFMYGCINQKSPYLAKELPYILSKHIQHFSYFNCNFATPKSKEGTSRITLWKSGIYYSYTYELSFCGPQKERRHFNIRDYQTIGVQLCKSLCGYFYNRVLQLQIDQEMDKHCQEFYHDQELLNMGNQQTNGSSSELEIETVKEAFSPPHQSHLIRKRYPAMQKAEHKELNYLLENYLSKYQGSQRKSTYSRIDEPSKERLQEKKKVESDKEIYMKQRQSFVATKVNLQELELQDHFFSSMSTFYALASDKSKEPVIPKSNSQNISEKRGDKKEHQTYGLLLPNVQKGQYKRYERYKKDKQPGQERSVSMHVQSLIQQNAINQLFRSQAVRNQPVIIKRDLSMSERIRSRVKERKDTNF